MKIKTFMLLLMLSAGACTVPPHSSGNQDTQQWQQTIQQLNTLLKERKHQAAIDEGKQKISELLAVADHTEPKDTMVKYARQMVCMCIQSVRIRYQVRTKSELLLEMMLLRRWFRLIA